MTEEIKEILDKFSNRKQATLLQAIRELKEQDVKHACVTTEENINKLLNYITNLQKENTDLKKLCDKYEEEHKTTFETWKKVIARNEKGIEYIKQHCDRPGRLLLPKIDFNYNDLLNILEGGDEE